MATESAEPGRPIPAYEVPALPEATIVVLPQSIEGDVGIYPNATTMLVKELRVAGIPAEYLHDAGHRQWQVHMGYIPVDLIIGVSSSLIGTGIWASFAKFLGGRDGARSGTVHIVRQRRKANGDLESTTVDITGPASQLRELLEAALGDTTDEHGE